jgi:hypothetical protein
MYPYLPDGIQNKSHIFEVKGLSCRPCTKLGFEKCPKGHFNCMNLIDEDKIAYLINNPVIPSVVEGLNKVEQ